MALLDRIDLDLLTGIVISHQHPDHCADLLIAYHALVFGATTYPPVPVLAPQSVINRVSEFVEATAGNHLYQAFAFDPVADGDERRLGEFDISFARADHSVPTLASRWTGGGRVLGFSADTGPGGDWARVAERADLFLCEASYQGEPGVNEYPFHLTATEAGRIARARGAKRLVLAHIPPHLDVALSVEEAEAEYGRSVAAAVPGGRHDV